MTYKLGVTGGIATGKSSIARELAALGFPVVDADSIARQVVAPGSPLLAAIATEFGAEVVDQDGTLNRPALAQLVFGHDAALGRLNALMQPAIRREFVRQLHAAVATGAEIVVGDVPLLFEQQYQEYFDGIVVAVADKEYQLERIMARDGLSQVQARHRIEAQMPLSSKVQQADFTVNTMGPEELRHVQVMQLVRHIKNLV
ncbi:dephospho-CoA kinase [Lacticaseibacillus sharpeae]|uniref:Dephospho-CoA kinase n=1 Tax=Lacticaseibacillus sharpeae JCM 1186 = DSM 20505 TaxID=1291052 RepID=A0A0R1ZT78_9LACO|nr:dephospho-CoA kinase [Lacticaseibacillus sharpeae]KRM54905.1 dephospho-CoA kinase [Lacticaseibacillus sharpeae JCM 1186 = DSM 20505]